MSARERDALIAEHVMGRELPTRDEMVAEARRVWETQPDCLSFHTLGGFFARKTDGLYIETQPACPRYTTDAKDCASVIEAMRERGFVVRLDNGLDGTWEATFYKPETVEEENAISPEFYAPSDTMPECVSIAALRAVGITVETE